MNSNKKITLIIFSMVTLLTLIIVALVAIGSRESGYESAKKRAYLTADIVKNALTSHMVNGNMNQRDVFLDSLERLRELNELWVVRSPKISEQFGTKTNNEIPRDEIDEEVLKGGKEKVVISESIERATLRITIPYTASSLDKPNCLSCHNAKEGEVLGAISIKFDIEADRMSSIKILLNIIATVVIFLIFILIFISRKIKPYTTSFDYITDVLKQVHEGNYSIRAKKGSLKEDKEAFMWLNEIIEKLETVLTGIEKNLTSFVHNRASNVNNDKLLTAKEIIEDISEIYNYKKTIETDLSKDDIYYRLIQVLKDKLKIETFFIFENDLIKDERTVIYAPNNSILPSCNIRKEIKELCRAERTKNIVASEAFPEVCRFATCDNQADYTCIPFTINDQKSITIHILCNGKACVDNNKYQIGIIKKYLEETKPILESKILMDVLKERNLKDGLTGLYNRKYLDEFVDKTIPKELIQNVTYAVMFLDVDYFKMVNDTYGHDAGDAILQKLAQTMKKNVSDSDIIVRFGGEEFLIIMRNPTEESAKELALKMNQEFEKIIFKFNNETFSKTVSIGYAFYPKDTDQFWKCIKYADLSLYEAKETGRNKVIRFRKDILKNGDKADY
ncbi:GGDEF domain-containing protein [Halarcobacter ebronensis]|uniref:diguanylate cyclase n=1 Tax=Halarcobacter ebronensis TaxID=1462615 RepID=A0A4Q0YDM8_9BACT|nr:GGDEF domain-containing protein [Halarcobacter ebronensis]RXJ66991.1 GGDEF domain-containing protein [Halarcobacter ebronensis]